MKQIAAAETYLRWLFRAEMRQDGEWVAFDTAEGLGDSLYVSLATADPAGGDQSTHELQYDGFSRQRTRRKQSESDWTVDENSVTLATMLRFGPRENPGSTEYLFWTLGLDPDGPGPLLYSGPLCLEAPAPCVIEKSGRVLCPGRDWQVGERVMFQPIGASPLPKDVSKSIAYHVVKADGGGFFVSAKAGGEPGHPGVGSGLVAPAMPRIVAQEDEPQIRPGALRIFEE